MRFKQICAWILLYAVILAPAPGLAAYPPTTTKGQLDANKTTTFNFVAPAYQVTKTDTVTGLLETESTNILKNPSFEAATFSDGWTKTGAGTWAASTPLGLGAKSLLWSPTGAGETIISTAVTIPDSFKGKTGEVVCSVQVPSGANNADLGFWNGTSDLGTPGSFSSAPSTGSAEIKGTVTFPSSGTIALKFTSGSSTDPIKIDNCRMGMLTNTLAVPQASFYGGMSQSGATNCTFSESTSSGLTNWIDLGLAASCASPWVTSGPPGNVTAVGPTSHQMTLTNMPPGEYAFQISAQLYTSGSGQNCNFRLSDGTNTFGFQPLFGSGAGAVVGGPILGRVTYSSGGTRTFKVQAADDGVNACSINNATAGNEFIWRVFRYPSAFEQVISAANQRGQNVIHLTTIGSGTYIPTAGATAATVYFFGGGGGGGGSGTGGTGSNTVFSTLTSVGGVGGSNGGAGNGGTVTGTLPTNAVYLYPSLLGNSGHPPAYTTGGNGGSGLFGGAGKASYNNFGGNGVPYTGGGGGGGGTSSSAAIGGGGGGSSGPGAIRITGLAASYSYTIGAGGTAGAGGGSNYVGGGGGQGSIIIIEEFGPTVGFVANSVVSRDNNGVTTINTVTNKTANATLTISEETVTITPSSANLVITLPAASSVKGKKYHLRMTTNPATVAFWATITPLGSDLICEQATARMIGLGDSMVIQSDGANWIGLEDGTCSRRLGGLVATTCATTTCAVTSSDGNAFTSVTRNGTGDYTINWTNAIRFLDNYACVSDSTTGQRRSLSYNGSTFLMNTWSTAGVAIDAALSWICRGKRGI